MIERRPFATLGGANHGWLKAKHHFSFASYYDPKRMGWGALRVWNDDEIASETGFPPHPHADMEIITYVRQGAITHADNLGNEGRTEAGDVQVMSAGTGIRHSEYNHEPETTKIFQIWIEPTGRGQKPAWGARPFPKQDRSGRFVTLASGPDENGRCAPDPGRCSGARSHPEGRGDGGVFPGEGPPRLLGRRLGVDRGQWRAPSERDGAAIENERELRVMAVEDAEIVLVDVT